MKPVEGERTIWLRSGRTSEKTIFSRSAERVFFFTPSNYPMPLLRKGYFFQLLIPIFIYPFAILLGFVYFVIDLNDGVILDLIGRLKFVLLLLSFD